MKEYKLELIEERTGYVIRYKYYQVVDYDNDIEALKEYVKELNSNSLFNIDWCIKDEEKGILEETIDTLD